MNLVQITCTFKWQTLSPFTQTELLKIGIQLWKLRLSVITGIFFQPAKDSFYLHDIYTGSHLLSVLYY